MQTQKRNKDYRPPKERRILTKGDTRSDGMVFLQYRPDFPPEGEHWVSREKFKEIIHLTKLNKKDYRPSKEERTLTMGNVRDDGKIFFKYSAGSPPNGEVWYDEEVFKKKLKDHKNRIRRNYERRQKTGQLKDNRPAKNLRVLKRGDVGEDGKVFSKYKNDARNGEVWIDKSKFYKTHEREKSYSREYNFRTRLYKNRNRLFANERARKYHAKRKKTDVYYCLKRVLRGRVNVALKRAKASKKVSAIESVGCTTKFLKSYLETRFQPGMTWDNYGLEWHIDHVKPLASFDLSKKSQQMKANHYTNLQPLWALDNIVKGKSVLEQIELI